MQETREQFRGEGPMPEGRFTSTPTNATKVPAFLSIIGKTKLINKVIEYRCFNSLDGDDSFSGRQFLVA